MPSSNSRENESKRKQYWKEYREKNKKYLNEKENHRRKRLKEWLRCYKDKLSCSKCSESENHCLDFHHIKEKKFSINFMVNNSYSIPRMEEEIEKCIVLCGNCHRIHHYGTFGLKNTMRAKNPRENNIKRSNKRRKVLRIWIYKIKSRINCYICEFGHPRALDFHHILPKLYGINEMTHRSFAKYRIINEIKKCIPLCVNCHRKIHNEIIDMKISDTQLTEYWTQFIEYFD